MNHKFPIYILLSVVCALVVMTGCIEDGFTTSPSAQPEFSIDTLDIGTVFTGESTTTSRFVVRNRNSKGLLISSIYISGDAAEYYRLNVDGMSGRDFSDVEIRAKDSIYIFVEATLPATAEIDETEYKASIDFLTNGVTSNVTLISSGLNVNTLSDIRIDTDIRWESAMPYRVLDSIVVEEGATLTIGAGARVMMHDRASMRIRGNLVCEGTAESPITISGDRTGNVVGQISFDLMSKQWDGIYIYSTSAENSLKYTTIKNSTAGLRIENSNLYMLNCVLRNSGSDDLYAYDADVTAIGCEFSEAGEHLVTLVGGTAELNHCTLANNYLFASMRGAALNLQHLYDKPVEELINRPYTKAELSNCIIYGLGSEVSQNDLSGTDVYLRRCLLKSAGSDDANFIACVWDTDPMYFTIREDYIFDYRLKAESPALTVANSQLTHPDATIDRYGLTRALELGAYAFDPTVEDYE